MSNMWYVNEAGDWAVSAIPAADRFVLLDRHKTCPAPRFTPRKRVKAVAHRHETSPKLLLVRTGHAAGERWFVIPYPDARLWLNGARLATGMSELAHRDVMSLGAIEGNDWIFSTETLPEVEVFSGAAGLQCVRCKLEVEAGHRVVVCPGCRSVHHQDEAIKKPCWTYSPNCSLCSRDTSLANPAYSWTPDEL